MESVEARDVIKQEPDLDEDSGDTTPRAGSPDSFLQPYDTVKEEFIKKENEIPRALRDTPMSDDGGGSATPRARSPFIADYTPVRMVGDATLRARSPNSEPPWTYQTPNADVSPTPFFDAHFAAGYQRQDTEESEGPLSLSWFMDRRSQFSESTAGPTPAPASRTLTPSRGSYPNEEVDESFAREEWVDVGRDEDHPMKVEEED